MQHCKKRGTYHHYDDEIQAKIAKYSCIYESLKFIFAKMTIILETQNILATNISRFTVSSLLEYASSLIPMHLIPPRGPFYNYAHAQTVCTRCSLVRKVLQANHAHKCKRCKTR